MLVWIGQRWRLLAAGACGVALVAGGAVLALRPSAPERLAGPGGSRQVELHTGGEPGEQPRIGAVRDVLGRLPDDLATGRSDSLAAPLTGKATELAAVWRPAAKTDVDPATWRRTGDVATVVATVTASTHPAKVWLTLSFESGGWRLADVERMNS
ncbi:hypothetical protein [Micromonospora sp. NPDC048947]|uniref:hypothetical protein n=1 Tax=Micromonospora sp. NPDC048947 TaxID=3154826 RepID=UPI0033E4DE5E